MCVRVCVCVCLCVRVCVYKDSHALKPVPITNYQAEIGKNLTEKYFNLCDSLCSIYFLFIYIKTDTTSFDEFRHEF